MSGKRGPTSDLNHNNWDQDEEPEEAGHFKEASENELKTRVIKKARRRINDSTDSDGSAPKIVFGGFTGFGKTTAESANKSSPFSFLNKIPSAAGTASSATTTATPGTSFIITTSAAEPKKTETASFTFGKKEPSKDEAYYAKVIKLNQSFCEWIKKHVDEQPLCDLMSTFKDYEKHWEQLKQEKQSTNALSAATASSTSTTATPLIFSKTNVTSANQATSFVMTTTAAKTDNKNGISFGFEKPNGNTVTSPSNGSSGIAKFGSPNLMSASPKADAPKPFSFGIKTDDKPAGSTVTPLSGSTGFSFGLKKDAPTAAAPVAPFSFGLKTGDKPATTGFSFTAGSVPFSFGNIKPPAAVVPSASKDDNADGEEKDDDEDEPPKVEIKEIVEEDAFYTKKCKVFVKKDNAYKDFGIATLYLKTVDGSSKTQLLVRSSVLGKILINTLLVEGTPAQRVGKNNVMIIYPNAEGENQTNLIRVKDASEADDLLETINKHKK